MARNQIKENVEALLRAQAGVVLSFGSFGFLEAIEHGAFQIHAGLNSMRSGAAKAR